MNFREYRRKETIKAAEIDLDRLILPPAGLKTIEPNELASVEFTRGDFAELQDGRQFGWKKVDFEKEFVFVRAPRQSKQVKQKRKNERVTPLPDLATK